MHCEIRLEVGQAHITLREALRLSLSTRFWREDSTAGRGARPDRDDQQGAVPTTTQGVTLP